MAHTVEFLNPGKRRRKRSRRRGMSALQRRYFGGGRRNPRRRRRARRNPATFAVVPAFANRGRRYKGHRRRSRRHGLRNPAILTRITSSLTPALAAVFTMFAGWTAGKTLNKGSDTGVKSYAVNLAGGIAAAFAVSMLVKRQEVRAGLWTGAVMSPLAHVTGDMLKGRALPFGVRTGFEDAMPMGFQDYFVPEGSGLNDYLAPLRLGPPRSEDQLEGFGYAEAGQTPFGTA